MIPKGILLRTDDRPAPELLETVERLEADGCDSVWLPEMFSREPTTTAAFLLSHTRRIRVATGIANVYVRDAHCMAQTRHTLAELSGGRFILGLGVSNATVNAERGHEWQAPVEKMRTYLKAMDAVRVQAPRPPDMGPLYLAAHGPRLQALAAERADGFITYLMPPAHTRTSRERTGAGPRLIAVFPYLAERDPDTARATIRRQMKPYFGLDYYHREWRKLGFTDDDFAGGGSDTLVDAICVWGDRSALEGRVADYEQAGASGVVILPLSQASLTV